MGELIEHQMQVAKQGAERMPVVMFVVGVQNEGVREFFPKVLHDGMVLPVFLRDLTRNSTRNRHNYPPSWISSNSRSTLPGVLAFSRRACHLLARNRQAMRPRFTGFD